MLDSEDSQGDVNFEREGESSSHPVYAYMFSSEAGTHIVCSYIQYTLAVVFMASHCNYGTVMM